MAASASSEGSGGRLRTVGPQLLLGVVLGAMFLPWGDEAAGGSVRGFDVAEGTLVALVALVTVGLVQLGVRPAWIGAGFIVAVLGRELIGGATGAAVIVGLIAAVGATGILVATMVADVDSGPPDG